MPKVGKDNPCTNHKVGAYIFGGSAEPHGRPHFHLRCSEWKVSICIETGELLQDDKNAPRKDIAEGEQWRLKNLELLRKEWRRMNATE